MLEYSRLYSKEKPNEVGYRVGCTIKNIEYVTISMHSRG